MSEGRDMASEKKDPTVSTKMAESPEGTHPARLASETTHGKPSEYKDNPDKPDPTSIAQVEVLPEKKV